MSKYDVRAMANHVESFGRMGDTELVHLNPAEVAGLAALSPTGKLTVNPTTGKKEAFLPLLIPIIASYGGSALAASAGASMVGAAIAGGAASGLATYAQTGDAERGLYSGIMGAGLGAAAGAAGEAARGAVDPAISEGIGALGTDAVAQGTLGADATAFLTPEMTGEAAGAALGPTNLTPPAQMPGAAPPAYMNQAAPAGNMFMTGQGPVEGGFKQTLQDPFMAPQGGGMVSQMTKPQHLMPVAVGANQLMEMDAMDEQDGMAKEEEAKRKARLKQAYSDLQGGYAAAQPGAERGASRYRSGMSRNMPAPYDPEGMASGGITRLAAGGNTRSRGVTYGEDYLRPGYDEAGDNGYSGIDPITVQAGLRGQHHVATAPGYMAGMQPEFNYYQNDLENIQVPQMFTPEQLNAPYRTRMNAPIGQGQQPYFGSVIPQKEETPEGMAAGGQVPVQMGGEQAMIQPGGIAGIPTPYNGDVPQTPNAPLPDAMPEPGGQPSEQDITILASALMGEKPPELADQIVNAFVAQYGSEKFAETRDQILKMIQGPNAQTEGLIQGQGGGMDDQVMGTIGAEQPVAVSPGEYIVPADAVSGLGDGSSDAGAAELDKMVGNVRMARGGTTNQPPPFDARKVLPA